MADPIRLPSGELAQFTLKVSGNPFRCACGCNVFHKPDSTQPEFYECNSCANQYKAD